jgi:hypothetical protein
MHAGAVAREAGDAMEARRLKGFGQGHGRQDRGESPRQHGRARPGRADEEQIMTTTCITFSFDKASKGAEGYRS